MHEYAGLTLRSTDSYGQVSNINDWIRIIRNLASGALKLLPYVKTGDGNFDNSQEQVRNTNIIINKPTHLKFIILRAGVRLHIRSRTGQSDE